MRLVVIIGVGGVARSYSLRDAHFANPASMSEAQVTGLADDLESLAAGTLAEADFRDRYAAAEPFAVLGIVWPNLEHYFADADIRRRDLSYRAMQDAEMAKLVRLLRAGAPHAELAKIHFLGRS